MKNNKYAESIWRTYYLVLALIVNCACSPEKPVDESADKKIVSKEKEATQDSADAGKVIDDAGWFIVDANGGRVRIWEEGEVESIGWLGSSVHLKYGVCSAEGEPLWNPMLYNYILVSDGYTTPVLSMDDLVGSVVLDDPADVLEFVRLFATQHYDDYIIVPADFYEVVIVESRDSPLIGMGGKMSAEKAKNLGFKPARVEKKGDSYEVERYMVKQHPSEHNHAVAVLLRESVDTDGKYQVISAEDVGTVNDVGWPGYW